MLIIEVQNTQEKNDIIHWFHQIPEQKITWDFPDYKAQPFSLMR